MVVTVVTVTVLAEAETVVVQAVTAVVTKVTEAHQAEIETETKQKTPKYYSPLHMLHLEHILNSPYF